MTTAKKRLFFVVSGLLITLFALQAAPSQADAVVSTDVGLHVLQSNADGLQLRLNMADVTLTETLVDGVRYQAVSIDDFATISAAGHPDLPQKGWQLAVPPGAVPSVRLVSAEPTTINNVNPLPEPVRHLTAFDFADASSIPEFNDTILPNDLLRDMTPGLYPASVVELGEVTQLRDLRVVNLFVRPVQADLARQQLIVHDHLNILVEFNYPNGQPVVDGSARPESAVFDAALAANIVNYDQAQAWRAIPENRASAAPSPCLGANAYRISVEETGVYRIGPSDLPNLPTSVMINSLRMCHGANEIAINTVGNGTFAGNDELYFYGEALKTHDTETNVYWLTYGGANGLRMGSIADSGGGTGANSYLATYQVEEDTTYFPQIPIFDNNDSYDHWFQARIAYASSLPETHSVEIETRNLTGGEMVEISAEVWGFSSFEDHNFQFELNGTAVGEVHSFEQNGNFGTPVIRSSMVASSLFNNGANTVSIRALANDEATGQHIMLVNWIQVEGARGFVAIDGQLAFEQPAAGQWAYSTQGFSGTPRAYDVTDPTDVKILANVSGSLRPSQAQTTFPASYIAVDGNGLKTPTLIEKDTASNLMDGSNSADYIIITNETLSSALPPLIDQRRNDGLTVSTVYVQDIFDEFSYGIYSTEAIREFLYYTYTDWNGSNGNASAPSYVLLAGDASHDHRDVLGNNNGRNLVPVYLRSGVDSFLGEAAADNQYVAFGEWPDQGELPFMNLGRLPAENSAELSTMINKIVTYENTPQSPATQASHLFIADNQLQDTRQSGCAPDPAGAFFDIIENFIPDFVVEQGQFAHRLYYARCHENETPRPGYYTFDDADMTARVIQSFDAGNGFVTYVGHAGTVVWGDERFVNIDSVSSFTNGDKTPILLPMACLEGQYHRFDLQYDGNPTNNGLSEAMVKHGNGGAVASYAPTGLQVTTGHDLLLEGFYKAIYQDGLHEMGSAILSAKLTLEDAGSYQDLHDTFMLIGDPAMQIQTWSATSHIQLPILSK